MVMNEVTKSQKKENSYIYLGLGCVEPIEVDLEHFGALVLYYHIVAMASPMPVPGPPSWPSGSSRIPNIKWRGVSAFHVFAAGHRLVCG